jgi:hypothetical protein
LGAIFRNLEINLEIMKKLFCLIFIFGISAISLSQNINLKEKKLSEIICKTWKFDYGLGNGKKIENLEFFANDSYTFKNDKTYILKSGNFETVNGTWKYDLQNKNVLLFRVDGNPSGIIKSIKENEFILIPPKNSLPKGFDVEFYFK